MASPSLIKGLHETLKPLPAALGIYANRFGTTSQQRPRRPQSSFLLFLQQQGPSNVLSKKEWVKQQSENWRSLDQGDKKLYVDQSKAAFEKYKLDMKSFRESLSDFEWDQVQRASQERRAHLQKLRQKKTAKLLGIPKRPLSSYAFFVQHKFQTTPGGQLSTQSTNLLSAFAKEWKSLSEDQKKDFEAKARLDRDRYDGEMKVYVDNLRRANREDLIPRSFLRSEQQLKRRAEAKAKMQQLIDKLEKM